MAGNASRVLALAIVIPLVGSGLRPGPHSQAPLVTPHVSENTIPFLRDQYEQARDLFRSGQYLKSKEICERGLRDSKAGQPELAVKYLTLLGSCRFALFQYPEALRSYLEARRASQAAGNIAMVRLLNSNISAIYLQMNELDSAAEAIEQNLRLRAAGEEPQQQIKILMQLAAVRGRQKRDAESERAFFQAIELADETGDPETASLGWDLLGSQFLAANRLRQAEIALATGFRLRKLHHLHQIETSYRNLGRLRLLQGDLTSAAHLLDQAIALRSKSTSLISVHSIYHSRGQVRLQQGDISGALEDFRTAVDLARSWRLEVLPADATRVSSETSLQEIYSSFIETANQLYFARPDAALAIEAFQAVEENRAASLRALLTNDGDWSRSLPPAYWEQLTRLHAAEVALLRSDTEENRRLLQSLRTAVLEMETGVKDQAPIPANSLERVRQSLQPGTVLFSFHLGRRASSLWAITRQGFELYRLAPKSVIEPQIARFTEAVKTNGGDTVEAGRQLYETLFGPVAANFLSQPDWRIALDEQLFGAPLAALVRNEEGGKPVYLCQLHSLQVVSSAALMAQQQNARPFQGPFLGIGDPIYNEADPRWTAAQPARAFRFSIFPRVLAASRAARVTRMARLVGSGVEVEACARVGSPEGVAPVLLEGMQASKERLRQALDRGPSIVHFATHVVQAPHPLRHGLIALSLAREPGDEFLSPTEIRNWRVNAGLVVLSGCSSGVGRTLPGAGLLGMTRAWLAAGAGAVVSTYWPTPDDSGALLIDFYKNLRQMPPSGAAAALQQAQTAMIASGSWRSVAKYWAAYSIMGNY